MVENTHGAERNMAARSEFYYKAYLGPHVLQCFARRDDVPQVAIDKIDELGLDYDPQLFVPVEIDDEDAILVSDSPQPPGTVKLITQPPSFEKPPRQTIDWTRRGLPMSIRDKNGVIHILGY